jgi:hypothetical protein
LAIGNLKKSAASWFDMTPTGFAYLNKAMEKVLIDSFIETFVLALVGILVVLFIIARSIRLGLACGLANLFPVLIVLGTMGYLGKGLEIGVVIIPAVGLGLIVDDTIHFVMALKRATGSPVERVEQALRACGWPIAMTQVILIVTFGCLSLSYFTFNVSLGVFMVMLLVIGLVFDLLFVPAVVLSFGRD